MRSLFGLALLIAPLAPAHSQTMPVSQFLVIAEALQKKGPLALLSGDLKRLKAEIGGAAKAIRADQVAARKAGRKPATCIPDKAAVNSDELMKHFRAIPPAQRNMTTKAAFASLMRQIYPCPA